MKRLGMLMLAVFLCAALHAQRLPRTVLPTHYDLKFVPDIERATFEGTADISVSVQQPATTVIVNAIDLDIRRASMTSDGRAQSARVEYDTNAETATLTVDRALEPGPVTLHFEYAGKLTANYKGLYLGDAGGKKYLTSQFESTDARRAFPSFDEPEMKATFAISVVVPNGQMALSNGAVMSDEPGPAAGKHTIRFRTTPRISPYLVALVTGDFRCVEETVDGVPSRVCAPPQKMAQTKFAVDATRSFVPFYNRYYGIRYPFGKLDQVAVDLPGAMENAATITYMDAYLLLDDATASVEQRQSVAKVIAHEIAHQWFGDLVTMRWWDDIWLNEGFATWMETKAVSQWKPEWVTPVDDVVTSSAPMITDVLASTRQIQATAETPAEIEQLFDSIAYGKTGAVLRMIESYTGEDAFRAGVNRYFERHVWSNTTADDFANALAAASTPDVAKVMQSFVHLPGVPMVTVATRCDAGQTIVNLSQHRFYVDPVLLAKASPELWTIPVCMHPLGGTKTCTMLSMQSSEFRVAGCDPLFANAGGRGYYVTRYSPDTARSLAGSLDQLPASERLAFVRDEATLARAGARSAADLIALLEKFRGETDPKVAKYVVDLYEPMERYAELAGAGDQFRKWMVVQLKPLAAPLGWTVQPGEPDARQQLRAAVLEKLGRIARDPETLRRSRVLAEKSLADPTQLHSSLWGAIWQNAASAGDARLFDRMQRALETSTNAQNHNPLMLALGRFRDPVLVRRAYELSFSPKLTRTDAALFRFFLFFNPDQALVWRLLKENWTRVGKESSGQLTTFVAGGTGYMCDATLRKDVDAFFAANKVPGFERGLAQALEKIDRCVDTANLQSESLRAWAKAAS